MKTNTKFLRVLAVAAAVALPSHALADRHDRPGFYVGGGGHLNNAEFGFTKAFTDAVTLTFSGVAGSVQTGGSATTLTGALTMAATGASVTFTSDDKSAFGYSMHGGYRINQYFAVEGAYALLGEFSSKFELSAPNGTTIGGITLAAANNKPVGGSYTAEATAISGSALGTYPLADNATVFGRLGYYAVSVEESLSAISLTATDSGAPDANGEGAFAATSAGINKDLAGDTSGFLFGGGVEVKFGPKQNILVRAEFELLSDAIAEAEAITRFGITGSYNF